MTDPSDDLAQRLGTLVWHLARRLRMENPLKDGLSMSHVAALSHLRRLGTATSAELAALELISPQAMQALVGALREADLVHDVPHDGDQRRKPVALTPRGHEFLGRRSQASAEWITETILAGLSTSERAVIDHAVTLLGRAEDTSRRDLPCRASRT